MVKSYQIRGDITLKGGYVQESCRILGIAGDTLKVKGYKKRSPTYISIDSIQKCQCYHKAVYTEQKDLVFTLEKNAVQYCRDIEELCNYSKKEEVTPEIDYLYKNVKTIAKRGNPYITGKTLTSEDYQKNQALEQAKWEEKSKEEKPKKASYPKREIIINSDDVEEICNASQELYSGIVESDTKLMSTIQLMEILENCEEILRKSKKQSKKTIKPTNTKIVKPTHKKTIKYPQSRYQILKEAEEYIKEGTDDYHFNIPYDEPVKKYTSLSKIRQTRRTNPPRRNYYYQTNY